MRILAVSSQVAFGPVGNTAAVPALQARGHEVLAVPTIMLSNHPGHGRPAGFRTQAADLAAIFATLDQLGALKGCAAVMTGFFASPEQVHETAKLIARMKAANPPLYVLVDPVMGDGDALYVPQAVAEAIRDELVPLASCITPNRFELEWLTGRSVTGIADALVAARALPVAEVLATSVPVAPHHLATLAILAGHHSEAISPLMDYVSHGTGDFLAGLYLAWRLGSTPEEALRRAMPVLDAAIARSTGTSVLDVAGGLHLE